MSNHVAEVHGHRTPAQSPLSLVHVANLNTSFLATSEACLAAVAVGFRCRLAGHDTDVASRLIDDIQFSGATENETCQPVMR